MHCVIWVNWTWVKLFHQPAKVSFTTHGEKMVVMPIKNKRKGSDKENLGWPLCKLPLRGINIHWCKMCEMRSTCSTCERTDMGWKVLSNSHTYSCKHELLLNNLLALSPVSLKEDWYVAMNCCSFCYLTSWWQPAGIREIETDIRADSCDHKFLSKWQSPWSLGGCFTPSFPLFWSDNTDLCGEGPR